MTMDVGALIVDLLDRSGVTHVFGVPGGQAAPLYAALANGGPRYVVMRDERNAAFAADAFARATRRIAVVDATAGAGVVNLPAGLAEAYNASIPVLALVTNVATNQSHLVDRGRAAQGVEQLAMLRPLVKRVFRVTSAATSAEVLLEALAGALGDRPGPVVVEVPQDVMSSQLEEPVDVPVAGTRVPRARPLPDPEALDGVAEMLRSSEKPLFVAGGGVLLSDARDELLRAARACGAAIATTLSGKGALLETDPAFAGVIGTIGHRYARALSDAADAVVLVGFKWGEGSTYGGRFPNRRQRVAWLDVDGTHGASRPDALALVGDARGGLRALGDALSKRTLAPRTAWLQSVAAAREGGRGEELREERSDAVPMHPQRVVAELSNAAGPRDALVCDASFASGWGAQHFAVRSHGQRTIFPRGMAGLGYAPGAAIGAAMGGNHERVWILAGDGAMTYALGELATIAAHRLPVAAVVLNNRSYGWIHWWQTISRDRGAEIARLPNVDFAAIASGFGIEARTVADPEELSSAFAWASSRSGPALLDVVTDVMQTPLHAYRRALEKRAHVAST